MQWKRLIAQQRIKEMMSSAFDHGTMGHAYLFCGDTGTGTFAAALELSMALLCAGETEPPCYRCASCRKVLSFSHPDFHVVMPLSLRKEHKAADGTVSEAGWNELAARVRERIEDPYLIPEFSTQPSIPVDWVRETTHAIRRGALEGGRNITVIDGIDSMKKESANAMLKTLEEPPPGTLLLLCTSRPHAVLPTILSRCQMVRFAALPPDVIRSELVSRYSVEEDDPRIDSVVHTGSLGRAWSMLRSSDSDGWKDAREFWDLITAGDWMPLFEKIDEFSEYGDYSRYENLFVQLLYGIRNAFFTKIRGSENYIMGDHRLSVPARETASSDSAEVCMRECETAISRIRARGNSGLVLINFAFSVMEWYHGKKQ